MSTFPDPTRLAQRDPIVIGLCGLARSGKSTAAEYLQDAYGFEPAAFADSLKSMLEEHLLNRGIDYAWLYEPQLKEQPIPGLGLSARRLMQAFGDAGRGLAADFWVDALAHAIGLRSMPDQAATPIHDRICLSDVRYPNEAALVRQHGGVLIHLVREQATPAHPHSSEQHAASLGATLTLVNNGPTTAGLHQLLDGAMASLGISPRGALVDEPLKF
jgi:hypothetical protein